MSSFSKRMGQLESSLSRVMVLSDNGEGLAEKNSSCKLDESLMIGNDDSSEFLRWERNLEGWVPLS